MVDLGRSLRPVRDWDLAVCAIGQEVQRGATWWPPGGPADGPGAATGYIWDPSTGTSPGLPCASVRDARLEHWEWVGRLLRPHYVRDRHWSSHDADGGRGTGT